MEGVEDIPAAVLDEGLDWSWQSFPEYLDALDATPHAIDVGAQLPHAPLRVFAMGERGIDHAETPTDDEIQSMARARRRPSTPAPSGSHLGSQNHVSSDGRITPSFSATDPELLGVAAAMGRTGKVCSRSTSTTADSTATSRLCVACARQRATAVDRVAAAAGAGPDTYRRVLAGFDAAAADGLYPARSGRGPPDRPAAVAPAVGSTPWQRRATYQEC